LDNIEEGYIGPMGESAPLSELREYLVKSFKKEMEKILDD
jgi:hypothetical protein